MGAEPHIAIQQLGLTVGHAQTESDPEFRSFLLLEKLLWALPGRPPPETANTLTAPGHQAGKQQQGVVNKARQQG